MRARDVVIVVAAVLFCIFGWSQEGSLNFQRAFKITLTDVSDHVIAKPIVVDPEGRGEPVLLASISFGELSKFETRFTRRNIENVFVPMTAKASVVVEGRIIGIGAGSLDLDKGGRKVAAVLTDDYRLVAIDIAKFEIIWSAEVLPIAAWMNVFHASVSVVPERVYEEDHGMITIAVRALDADRTPSTLFAAFNGRDGELRWRYFSDSVSTATLSATGIKGKDGWPMFPSIGDAANHTQRVSVKEGSQTNKISRLFEQPFSAYREVLSSALPHSYSHPWDAQLRPHVFFRSKSQPKAAARRTSGGKVTVRYNDRVIRVDREDYGQLGDKLAEWTAGRGRQLGQRRKHTRRRRPANVFVYHGKHGIEVVHLFTGSTITTVAPLKEYTTVYHDLNDDFTIDAISTSIGPRVATHSRHGVDLLDDCLGTVHTGIPLAEDEVLNVTICDTQGFLGNLGLLHNFLDGNVRGEEGSGALHALELLGSRNIVSKSTRSVTPLIVQTNSVKGPDLLQVERMAVFLINSGLVTCVDSSRKRVLWRTQTDATFEHVRKDRGADAIMTNADEEEKESRANPYPHLGTYSLHQRRPSDDVEYMGTLKTSYSQTDPYVLAVGVDHLVAINARSGRIERSVDLDEAPLGPVVVSDFNGDGSNDVIVVSGQHIYGFVGSTQASADTVTSLMVLMVALLLLLFFSREGHAKHDDPELSGLPTMHQPSVPSRPQIHKRSTD